LGDVNDDGVLNVLDVVSLVNVILGAADPTNYPEYYIPPYNVCDGCDYTCEAMGLFTCEDGSCEASAEDCEECDPIDYSSIQIPIFGGGNDTLDVDLISYPFDSSFHDLDIEKLVNILIASFTPDNNTNAVCGDVFDDGDYFYFIYSRAEAMVLQCNPFAFDQGIFPGHNNIIVFGEWNEVFSDTNHFALFMKTEKSGNLSWNLGS
jgi:hypothetical protein